MRVLHHVPLTFQHEKTMVHGGDDIDYMQHDEPPNPLIDNDIEMVRVIYFV